MKLLRGVFVAVALTLVLSARAPADLIKQSAAYNRTVLMTDAADHISGKTGLTLLVTASKAGGAFAGISPTVTDLGSGWYKIALTAAHTDTAGSLNLHVTAAGADPTDTADQIVGFDPADAAALGLSRLDAAVTSRMATFSLPANFAALAITGGGAVTAGTVSDKTGYALSGTQAFSNTGTWTGSLSGSVGSVAGGVTVGGYGAGLDPATLVLGATASGFNGAGTIGGKINSAASDAAAAVLSATVDGALTMKQVQALSVALLTGRFIVTDNPNAKTRTVAYYRADGTTPFAMQVTTYTTTALSVPVSRAAPTFSNLP